MPMFYPARAWNSPQRNLNRVVDRTKVETKAVDRAIDCGVTKRPLVIGELNEVVIGSPASPADTQIRKDFAEGRVATKGAEQIAICGRTEFVRIGRKDRVEIGMLPANPGREI